MSREQLFAQPAFIPPFVDLTRLRGLRVGLTGTSGVLGGVLARRISPVPTLLPFSGDVTDAGAVDAWVQEANFDICFHFAALVPVKQVESDPVRAYQINALGTFHLAAAIIRRRPSAWLFLASTSHVYRPRPSGDQTPIDEDGALEPATSYGASKLAGEQLVRPLLRHCGVAHCVGRLFSFSHATQKPPYLVPSIAQRIHALPPGAPMVLENANAVRDFLDAETIVDVILHLAVRRYQGVVNVGSGRGLTVEQVAQTVAEQIGRRIMVTDAGTNQSNALIADVRRLVAALAEAPRTPG